jgi:hypothetical protein
VPAGRRQRSLGPERTTAQSRAKRPVRQPSACRRCPCAGPTPFDRRPRACYTLRAEVCSQRFIRDTRGCCSRQIGAAVVEARPRSQVRVETTPLPGPAPAMERIMIRVRCFKCGNAFHLSEQVIANDLAAEAGGRKPTHYVAECPRCRQSIKVSLRGVHLPEPEGSSTQPQEPVPEG